MPIDTQTILPRHYQGRIVAIDDVMADTRILKVELDNRQKLAYRAGQYAMIGFTGLDPRPFSIASAPGQAHFELHIRSTGYGISAHALQNISLGAAVHIEAPFGQAHLRATARPVLAIAGGMGITPIKSIVEEHLARASHTPFYLYWGARTHDQIYLDQYFKDMCKRNSDLFYIPVLSDEKDSGPMRRGTVTAAVSEDFESLDEFDIYMAGPPAMISATLPVLMQKNARKDNIFSDGAI